MKLVLALLTNDNELKKFEEIDMQWVDKFNEEFKRNSVPYAENIYKEEFIDMTSLSMLSNFVLTEDDSQFTVNREPLKEILRKLFGYEQQENQVPDQRL